LDSNSSNRVNASAAAPANPASTWPSLPRRRTLRALDFITVWPRVTWPSPATATLPSRRTDRIVVAWNTLGFWLGSMGPPGPVHPQGGRRRPDQAPPSSATRPSGAQGEAGVAATAGVVKVHIGHAWIGEHPLELPRHVHALAHLGIHHRVRRVVGPQRHQPAGHVRRDLARAQHRALRVAAHEHRPGRAI